MLIKRIKNKDFQILLGLKELTYKADGADFPNDIQFYEKILEWAPWDSISTMSIGSSYYNAGYLDEALTWMRKAHSMDPKNYRIKENLELIESKMK